MRCCPVPTAALAAVWAGVRDVRPPVGAGGAAAGACRPGATTWASDGLALDADAAALSWELGSYGFDLYKPAKREPAQLSCLAPSAGASAAC